jgi:hypothetical protein
MHNSIYKLYYILKGTVHYLPKFEKPEIHLKHLKTSYTSQKLGLTFFKDYRLVKPRLHQTGQ